MCKGMELKMIGDALILTVSDQIEHLLYLLDQLPQVCFHIAAPVVFSDRMLELQSKGNVRLHTVTDEASISFLMRVCDVLLDINHYEEVDQVVARFSQAGKRVLAFDNTMHGQQGQECYSSSTPQAMVEAILDCLNQPHITVNDLDRIYQEGVWNSFEIGSSASLCVAQRVTCRNFESFQLPAGKLILYEGVFLNNYCSINCIDRIEIGSGTMIGEGVRFYDHDHTYTAERIEKWEWKMAPIMVGKDCWIGSNVTILKGVRIGDNTVIGAGCLIRQDIPANSIVYNNGDILIKPRK